MSKLSEWILSKEPILFFIFSVLNLYTIFEIGFYFSLDAPQHLYVANIIAELIKGNEYINNFIEFNDLIVGYWTGTFLLSIFKLFLPAAISLKLLLVIYYLSIAYAFRYLVRSVLKEASLVTFLIFPFSSTFFIGMGYFNFSLALAVLFLSLGYFIRNINQLNWKRLCILALLLLLQFLSHAFIYGITGLILIAYIVFYFFMTWQKSSSLNFAFKTFLKQTGLLFLASLISNLLFLNYVISIREITSYMGKQFVSPDNLIDGIIHIRFLSWFVKEEHSAMNLGIWAILIFLVVFTLVARIRQVVSQKELKSSKPGIQLQDFWGFATLIIIFMYFFYPDKLVTGNISLRILSLVFLSLLVWVSTQKYPAVISVIVFLAVIPITIGKKEFYMESVKGLSRTTQRVIENTSCMEANSVYLAIDYSSVWTHTHLTSIPGIDKPMVYVNAPQVHGQYPIIVNKEKCPRFYIGTQDNYSSKLFWSLVGNDTIPVRPVDYVVLIHSDYVDDSPEHRIILGELEKYYTRADCNPDARDQVYELNNREYLMQKYEEETSLTREEILRQESSLSNFYFQKYAELLQEYCLNDSINKIP